MNFSWTSGTKGLKISSYFSWRALSLKMLGNAANVLLTSNWYNSWRSVELFSAWMSIWTIFWSTRGTRRLIFTFAVTILWSESRSTVDYALHFRTEFLHFPLSKIWSIYVLWMLSGSFQVHIWWFHVVDDEKQIEVYCFHIS